MLNYILYRIGEFLALRLPLKTAYKIAVFISELHYIFAAKDRQRVEENLKAIFPEKSDREISQIKIRIFINFAKYLVDFFRFSKLNNDYIRRNVRIENIEHLDAALSKGRGVITVTAHLGNWELGGAIIALSGYPLWVVALPHKYSKVNNFFNFQRESKGVKVIPLGKAVKRSLTILNENKVLALVGDIDFSEKGVLLDFFGKPTIFPQGPAALSIKTGAAIVPGFMLRNSDDTFTLRFEKALEFNPSPLNDTEFISISNSNKNRGLKGLINEYKIIFEDYIRKSPDQWYMFRRFWKA